MCMGWTIAPCSQLALMTQMISSLPFFLSCFKSISQKTLCVMTTKLGIKKEQNQKGGYREVIWRSGSLLCRPKKFHVIIHFWLDLLLISFFFQEFVTLAAGSLVRFSNIFCVKLIWPLVCSKGCCNFFLCVVCVQLRQMSTAFATTGVRIPFVWVITPSTGVERVIFLKNERN